ncbi:MAG: class I SAM-dependent methyltransferase [Anaerolineae bacterium]
MKPEDAASARVDLLTLPFDQYQRYRVVARVADSVRLYRDQPQLRVLDVGGFHRTREGRPLLPAAHVLPSDFTVATDLGVGVPRNYVRASGASLPFRSEVFDLVITCDTLEHIPAASRAAFVDELLRVTTPCVLLIAPFDSEPTQRAERILHEHLATRGCAHEPLEEHFEHGLPSAGTLRAQLSANGLSFIEFADGYLAHWLPMMAMQLSPRVTPAFLAELNRFYNRHLSPTDRREPAYRRAFVIAKPGHEDLLPAISDAIDPGPAAGQLHADIADDLDCLLKHGHRDAQARLAFLEAENDRLMQVLRGYEQGRFIRLMRWIHQWLERVTGKSSGS